MKHATITALAEAMTARRAVAFAKRLSDAAEFILPDPAAPEALNAVGREVLAADRSETRTIGEEVWFIEARNPSPRLILIGAVHIAQALAPLGSMMGFTVLLVDPRRAFANEERFPNTEIMNEWPDTALQACRLDAGTAVVALAHDPKIDDPALDQALRSEAFYIGALGSRKSHAARCERLRALEHEDAALQRIHGPVGLDIGAVSAPEIALSVIAEIVAVRRHGRLGTRTT